MQNLWRVGKNSTPILSHMWIKVHEISRRCWGPPVVSNALAQLSISFRRHRPLNLPLSCNILENSCFLGPYLGEGNTPNFGQAFSYGTHFQTCGRFSLSSIWWARRVVDEKKIEERKRITVKEAKSTNDYIGRPNEESTKYSTYASCTLSTTLTFHVLTHHFKFWTFRLAPECQKLKIGG